MRHVTLTESISAFGGIALVIVAQHTAQHKCMAFAALADSVTSAADTLAAQAVGLPVAFTIT